MNVYSHLVAASFLQKSLKPDLPGDYYLGSAAPDFRYPARMPRKQTHISIEQISAYCAGYPHLRSFLLGYAVHCAVDEIDLGREFFHAFPMGAFRNRLPRQFAPVVIELYYLETLRVENRLSESSNEITRDLGFQDELVSAASRQMNRFLASPSLEMEIATLQANGFTADSRIEKYLQISRKINQHSLLKKLLFAGLIKSRLTRERFVSQLTIGKLKEWIGACRPG
jgi:hypothetical protein